MKTIKFCLGAALAFILVGCGAVSLGTLTQANLDKIHDDMSPAAVRSILGDPANSKTEPIPLVGGTQTTYTYRKDTSEVTILFKNDLMKEKIGTFGQ